MLGSFLEALKTLGSTQNDDWIDRLHYFLTSNTLIALSLLVSWKQFGGKPIECMTPKMYPGSWEDYAENYCWAQDTYFLPFDQSEIPTEDASRYNQKISYYQWVPFFLLFEAACFRLPSLVWRYLGGHSGIRVHEIVKLATDPKNIDREGRKETLHSLTMHLQNALRFHRRLIKKRILPHRHLKILNLPYTAFFVTLVYIFTKAIYLFNVAMQLYFMNLFLQTDTYRFYGLGALADILNGKQWELSGVFPRVTLCDFKVRTMGSNVQQYSVQCVLVINIFNEKIFVFLWFWFVILFILTSFSIVYWIFIMSFSRFSSWFITRHLELSELPFNAGTSRRDVRRFVNSYLKTDGVFLLRMINMHAGIIYGTDLVLELWKAFYGIEVEYVRQKSEQITPSPNDDDEDYNQNKLTYLRLRHNRADNSASAPSKEDEFDDALTDILVQPLECMKQPLPTIQEAARKQSRMIQNSSLARLNRGTSQEDTLRLGDHMESDDDDLAPLNKNVSMV